MILCILKMKEINMMLKELLLSFVLKLQVIVLIIYDYFKAMKISILERYLLKFQFSASGFGFSGLVPAPSKFNSLYWASDSLKIKQ